jgi:hypothetical protein
MTQQTDQTLTALTRIQHIKAGGDRKDLQYLSVNTDHSRPEKATVGTRQVSVS